MRLEIETKHLILKPLNPNDFLEAYIWLSDKEVNKYLVNKPFDNPFKVKDYIKSIDYDDQNLFDFGFYLKETNKPIGMGGFILNESNNTYIMSYQLSKRYWGHEYVLEALNALIEYLLKSKEKITISTLCAFDNHNSLRVIEKLNMTKIKETRYSKIDYSQVFKAYEYSKTFTR